jgi:flagellar basal-body rod protein FlgF
MPINQGLYTAFLGMRARQNTLDALANNLANASTTGFKAERLLYRSIEAADIEAKKTTPNTNNSDNNPGPPRENRTYGVITSSTTDFTIGQIRQTNQPLDVALDNEKTFFAIQTTGGTRYTRAGNFTLDANGQLVTFRGDLVIGERGPITIPRANGSNQITIGEDGTISANGQTIDRLKLAQFNTPSTALLKEGETLFLETGAEKPGPASNVRVMQGALEMSNINPLSEMVAMIQNSREFDSLQRSVTLMMNDLGRKIAGEIGRY